MSFFDGLKISASGLSAQRLRMNVIASNLANVNTTRTKEGGPYKKKEVIFETAQPFAQSLKQAQEALSGVKVKSVVESDMPPQMIYDPSHPDANELGYYAAPNINLVEEMVNMLSATRSYEANITALNDAKAMVAKALEIGR